jgi:deoxyinosine 3'endonuclease (endonuclease V)
MSSSSNLEQMATHQTQLAQYISHETDFIMDMVKYVAGLDISFDKSNPDRACGCLVILEYPGSANQKPVYQDVVMCTMTMPYISGYLAFREVPVYEILINRLREKRPDLEPSVYMVDGCGIFHARGVGSASHLGVSMDVPTIGISKTLLCMDGITEDSVDKLTKDLEKGSSVPLKGTSGKTYGAALKTSKNPIFVSIGHQISLEDTVTITRAVSFYREPEPLRQADIISRAELVKSKTPSKKQIARSGCI